jgi:hypothetical protein
MTRNSSSRKSVPIKWIGSQDELLLGADRRLNSTLVCGSQGIEAGLEATGLKFALKLPNLGLACLLGNALIAHQELHFDWTDSRRSTEFPADRLAQLVFVQRSRNGQRRLLDGLEGDVVQIENRFGGHLGIIRHGTRNVNVQALEIGAQAALGLEMIPDGGIIDSTGVAEAIEKLVFSELAERHTRRSWHRAPGQPGARPSLSFGPGRPS